MLKKIESLLIVGFVIFFTNVSAQDSAVKKVSIKADSIKNVLKTTDGKVVTVGEPVIFKPLSTTDKIKIFFKALYAKYPVWCWICGFLLLLAFFRLIKRLFS